jgi:hypothetical protein
MPLHYDFDILHQYPLVTPESQTRAAFRDPETRAAVLTLPEPARQWLARAGFVAEGEVTNLPPGHYAPQDELDRLHIMQRLTATMKDFDLAKAGKDTWSTFVIADFIDAMTRALPMPPALPSVPAPPQIPGPFAGLRGKAAKEALAKAAPRGWHPKPSATPFGVLAMARKQGFLKLTLGTVFLYCAVLAYVYR